MENRTPEEQALETVEETGEAVGGSPEAAQEKRNAWGIVATVLSRILIVFSVIVVIFTIISTILFNKEDREIFGVKMYVVLSDSMSATDFSAGDLILVKDVNPDKLKAGDIISFVSQNKGSVGEIVTHKIKERTTDEDGKPAFVTYGTTTGKEDQVVVTYEWIKGKYVGRIPWIGWVFDFLKTPTGYLVCILLPFGALIVYQSVNCLKAYREYRGEKTKAIRSERESLAREREETQRMLEEMRALKKQLEEQQANKEEGSREEEKSEE